MTTHMNVIHLRTLLSDALFLLANVHLVSDDQSTEPTEGEALGDEVISANRIVTPNSYVPITWDSPITYSSHTENDYSTNPLIWVTQQGKQPKYIVITDNSGLGGSLDVIEHVITKTLTTGEQAIYEASDATYFINRITFTISEV